MTYTLKQLKGRLLRFYNDNLNFEEVKTLAEADGVQFICPKCFKEDPDAEYPHEVTLWFSSIGKLSEKIQGHPGWNKSGSSLEDLTFVPPGAVSVLIKARCCWHGFVKNGTASIL